MATRRQPAAITKTSAANIQAALDAIHTKWPGASFEDVVIEKKSKNGETVYQIVFKVKI